MTTEELDLAVAEIIIPQEKPKSTGNSHKRKQWENRRNWRICTIGKSCKLGYLKICPIAKQKSSKLNMDKSSVCWHCVCWCHRTCGKAWLLVTPWFMGATHYSCRRTRYEKWSYNDKGLRIELNRRIRRTCSGDIGNYNYYMCMR